jgi:hypothetical protein
VGPSGNVYWTETQVSETVFGSLARWAPGGAVTRTEAPLPYAAAVGANGRIWVGARLDLPGGDDELEGAGIVCPVLDTFQAFQLQCAVPLDPPKARVTSVTPVAGGVWIVLNEADLIRRFEAPGDEPQGEPLDVVLPAGSRPYRSVIGPDGNLWATMQGASRIDRITPSGQRTEFPLAAGRGPSDIAVGPDGALWFTETQGNAIGRITTSGQITEFPVPTAGSAPFGIVAGPDGALWFTRQATGGLGRLVLDAPGTARGPSGGGGGALVADRSAPRVSPGLRLAGFRQGRGSTFTFSLSEPAKVAIKLERRIGTGRRVDGRCVRRTRRSRSRPSCTRYSSVGTVRADGRQGRNEVRFSGRLNGRALSPGTYRASLTATDAAGNASTVSRATFTVRRR